MENKQELAQELDFDQMEKVSGGSGEDVRTCPWCGQTFAIGDRSFPKHLRDCSKAPAAPIIIG